MKIPTFGTENAIFGYFWASILKNYWHIWNQQPQICRKWVFNSIVNSGIGSTFFKGSGSAFSEGPGPGPRPLYKVCPSSSSCYFPGINLSTVNFLNNEAISLQFFAYLNLVYFGWNKPEKTGANIMYSAQRNHLGQWYC